MKNAENMPAGEELSAYLDGELSPRQRREVERLLAASPDAREQLAQLRTTREELAALPRRNAPASLVGDCLRAFNHRLLFDGPARPAHGYRWLLRQTIVGYGAAAAATLAGLWVGYTLLRPPSSAAPGPPPAEQHALERVRPSALLAARTAEPLAAEQAPAVHSYGLTPGQLPPPELAAAAGEMRDSAAAPSAPAEVALLAKQDAPSPGTDVPPPIADGTTTRATVVVWVAPRDDGDYHDASQTLDTWWNRVGEDRDTGPGYCQHGSVESPAWSFRVPPCEMPQLVRALTGVVQDPQRVRVHMNVDLAANDARWQRLWQNPCPDALATAPLATREEKAAEARPADVHAVYDANFAAARARTPKPALADETGAASPGTRAAKALPLAGRGGPDPAKAHADRPTAPRSAGRPKRTQSDAVRRGRGDAAGRELLESATGVDAPLPPSEQIVALVPGTALGVRALGTELEPAYQATLATVDTPLLTRSAHSMRLQVFVLCPEEREMRQGPTPAVPARSTGPASRPGG